MIRKIRRDLEQVRAKKFHKFEDLNPLIERCLKYYGYLFPRLTITKRGSKTVYHFNVVGVNPISIEKQHGSRDSIPRYYARLILAGIEDLVTHVESSKDRAENV